MDYVGTRWFKCDFHLHTMMSECYPDDDSYENWIDEVCKKGLNCIAVTDHNDYRSIDQIKTLGKSKGITVFPGVEVTCDTSKIHILVLFDVDKTQENVRDFLNLIGIDSELVGKHSGTSKSVFDVCNLAKEKGALVIAAHIDDYCSISSISANSKKKLFDGDYLDAVQVVNSLEWENYKIHKDKGKLYAEIRAKYSDPVSEENIESWRKTYDKALSYGIPVIAASDNPREKGSPKHGLWGIGYRYTWIKMDKDPNLESIRQALLSADDRVRLDEISRTVPEKNPDIWLKSIKIIDTMINPPKKDISIEFNPQLNCIIGGRGSGKSSIVRMLTGGLQLADRSSSTIQSEQDNYYKKTETNKKTGEKTGVLKEKSKIEIQLVRNNIPYKIIINDIRQLKNQKRNIYKSDSITEDWVEVDENLLNFTYAQVYTQKEIFDIAKDPYALLNIIDREIEGIDDLKHDCESAFNSIISKKKEIQDYEKACENEQMLETTIKDVEEQIDFFRESGIADQIEMMQSVSNEETEITRIKETLDEYEIDIRDTLAKLPSLELHIAFDKCSDEFRNAYNTIKQNVENEIQNIYQIIESIHTTKNNISSIVENAGWNKKKHDATEAFDHALQELNKKGIEETKLEILLKDKVDKEKQLQLLKETKEKLILANKELSELSSHYDKQREILRNKRQSFVDSVLQQDNTVKIEFKPEADRKSFENMIKSLTEKNGAKINEDIEHLEEIVFGEKGIKRFRTIVRDIRNGQESKEGLSAVFRRAVLGMNEEDYYKLESFVPEDELDVSYKPNHGKKFVPLSIASPGQKTTAILTFILAHGDLPLILDQPEDDLDNKLVYDLVVNRLKKAKQHRQVIVVTHNANIPVNGDAEYITSMDSDSVFVKKKHEGTIDKLDIRSEICDVMEGSEFAFSMRAQKYHLKVTKE